MEGSVAATEQAKNPEYVELLRYHEYYSDTLRDVLTHIAVEALCMWNLPIFGQMVLYDPASRPCEGVVLFHRYEEEGKKILSASFQPTSTYLYKVNEKKLFEQLLGQMIVLAEDYAIDLLTVAKARHIRTNRTGGDFDRAMDAQIAKIGKEITLSQPEIFSFSPKYLQPALCVRWERES